MDAIYRPGPPLRELVDVMWHWDGHPALPTKDRALPAGCLDLILNLERDEVRVFDRDEVSLLGPFPGAIINGARARYTVVGATPAAAMMGIHFKPGGAFPFLGAPAGDLEDQHVPLEALWGSSVRALRDQLAETGDVSARFRVLEAYLLTRAVRPLAHHPAIDEALRAFEDPQLQRVAQVNERTGLSPRQLIARFREEVGLTPKAYWRVRRFQAAVRQLARARTRDGAALATQLGYFDQAHFIRDFRAFTGLSPRAYLKYEIARPNHVPLLRAGKNIQA